MKNCKTTVVPAGCGVEERAQGFCVFKIYPKGSRMGTGHVLALHTSLPTAIKKAWKALRDPARKDLESLRELNAINANIQPHAATSEIPERKPD